MLTEEEKFCSINSRSLLWNTGQRDIANKLSGQETKVDWMEIPYEGVKP